MLVYGSGSSLLLGSLKGFAIAEAHALDDLASRSEPSSRRQCRSADLASLKTMASAVWRDRQPLVLLVRSRTVAKVLSIGLTCGYASSARQEIIEGKQRLAILGQTDHSLVIFRSVLGEEAIKSILSFRRFAAS